MKRNEQIRAEAHRRYNGSTFFELKFIEGAEWADAHPRWISVDDELPEDNEWVLCYDNIDRCVSLLRYDGNRWWGDDGYGVDKRAINHWMPMPAPPKKGSTRLPYEKEEIFPNCIIGTPEHIQVALDVIDKKGGEQ